MFSSYIQASTVIRTSPYHFLIPQKQFSVATHKVSKRGVAASRFKIISKQDRLLLVLFKWSRLQSRGSLVQRSKPRRFNLEEYRFDTPQRRWEHWRHISRKPSPPVERTNNLDISTEETEWTGNYNFIHIKTWLRIQHILYNHHSPLPLRSLHP